MNKTHLKNIVAFCALMENNDGILGKSPSYIMEKFMRYAIDETNDQTGWGLDHGNDSKVKDWVAKWL